MASVEEELLVSIRTYSVDGINTLKTIINKINEEFNLDGISSVYHIRVSRNLDGIRNLKSSTYYEGLIVVILLKKVKDLFQMQRKLKELVEEVSIKMEHGASERILAFGSKILITPQLTVPDPEFHKNPEELLPAAEVCGDYFHPVLKSEISRLSKNITEKNWGQFFAQGKTLLDF